MAIPHKTAPFPQLSKEVTLPPPKEVVTTGDGGMTPEEIAREYGVTEEQVRAALAYAADLVKTTSGVAD